MGVYPLLMEKPIIKIIVEVSRNDLTTTQNQEAVSLAIEQQKLELGDLCDRQPWH